MDSRGQDQAALRADGSGSRRNEGAASPEAGAEPSRGAAQRLAERVRDGMAAQDRVLHAMAMRVEAVGPGFARLSMQVRDDMLNGFGICHGGIIATLGDTAFAYACNSRNALTVASGLTVDYVSPGRAGERLVAEAHEVALAGRSGLYDVRVTGADGRLVASLRGRSHRSGDRTVVPDGDA